MLKNYTKVEITTDGSKFYYNDKEQLHRLDGPAWELAAGTNYWFINDNKHRNIGPTFIGCKNKCWYFKGKPHRISGPSWYDCCYIHGKEYTKEEYYNIVWDI